MMAGAFAPARTKQKFLKSIHPPAAARALRPAASIL
jgi:hypothetical protein